MLFKICLICDDKCLSDKMPSNASTLKSVCTCPCGSRYWCCTVLCCAVLCCTVLYCTVLHCTVLYCTARVLWTAQVLVNKGKSSISTSIPLTSSKLLLSILFLCSKCLTLKPANPEVLSLLAEVIGEEQDKVSSLAMHVTSYFALSYLVYPFFHL